MKQPFQIIEPAAEQVPFILSIPHCGTAFPDELVNEFNGELIQAPDDTDWYVHQLYDFAAEMGITTIHAVYSRWVIDLNRDPEDKPLYSDGRIITGLCPVTNFFGESLYRDERIAVRQEEVERRRKLYYEPYHTALSSLIGKAKEAFGIALVWDCHSIRQHVPTIRPERFPDLILGDADGTSASPGLIEAAIKKLENAGYDFSHNHPFKGGYITRHYGRPSLNQHALQLEMSKVNYMDDAEKYYHHGRAEKMRSLLRHTLGELIDQLKG
ncbi:MAG: N-formylglutamate amidohydrolase [Cyclobacteriaceae bacterium]|nr:N-formylglutamate amidohydrolase [Cyclobacteriaceae bacterium]